MKLVRAKEGYRKVGDKYLLAKKCTKCGRWLVANTVNFHRSKNNKYGLRNYCKKCNKEYNKQHYLENKERIAERNRQYYQDHKEERLEYDRQYRLENKERIVERQRQHYLENKERIAERNRQYRQEHKEEELEYHRQWRKNNPDKALAISRRQNEKRRQARIDAIIAQKRAEYEAERTPLVAEKTCKCCGRTLPASEFYANKKSKDHLGSYCKECHKKKGQENYYHNLETKGWA